MKQYLGIIGGSGLYQIKDFQLKEAKEISTPYGKTSSPFMVGSLSGVDVIFIARHGLEHQLNPSEINFRANIWALKKLGVKAIFSVSAVGSLSDEITPGQMVIVDQFIDRTIKRASTFFENGIVAHVSMAHPVSAYLCSLLLKACSELKIKHHDGGTYVCIEGPQYSSRAESFFYRMLGAKVVGMTNAQEAKLAREAEIDYATLALCTDYDCWHDEHEHVTTDQVVAIVQSNVSKAQEIFKHAVKNFDFNRKLESEGILERAFLIKREAVTKEVIERLEPIIGRYFGRGV